MTVHCETSVELLRIFDEPANYENADPYEVIVTVKWIARDTVLLEGDLARSERTRKDLADVKALLISKGVRYVQSWRKTGKKPPWRGRKIRECGKLTLWETDFCQSND
ncbi:MAG: hypothetical protein CTY34_02040 [Methylobacter sp.]|nr:MAG: hypothetical protein CTY34_02040 [Methylobacter sp.]